MAGTWLPLAHRLLQAAGYEATLTEAAYALELAARLVAVSASAIAGKACRHPLAVLGIGAAIALVAYQAGYLKRGRLRAAGQEIRKVAATGIEAFGNATDAYGKARKALRVIEPYGTPTVEELAARHLARLRRPLPLDDLPAALEAAGHAVSTAELRDATSRHPAFRTRASQPALIGIGRIARLSTAAITPGLARRRRPWAWGSSHLLFCCTAATRTWARCGKGNAEGCSRRNRSPRHHGGKGWRPLR